uniref:condensation domain-containing protein n=1 Tax=uncultured Shewanella sp. TaxID=173975 RepID=UPI0026324167
DDVRQGPLYQEAEAYWQDKLPDYNFDAQLPMVLNPSSISTPRFARLTQTIPTSIWSQLEKKASQYGVSPTSVILYAYSQILFKWSGQNKYCVNLTLFNRLPLHEQVNHILGDFTVLELFNATRQ